MLPTSVARGTIAPTHWRVSLLPQCEKTGAPCTALPQVCRSGWKPGGSIPPTQGDAPPPSLLPSLSAGSGLSRLAGPPPNLPCWWEGGQAQPVCPPWRPRQAALPRPHEELAAACQPVSHLERAPAAAQTFQRGHADANPTQGLGNQAAGKPTVRKPQVSPFPVDVSKVT